MTEARPQLYIGTENGVVLCVDRLKEHEAAGSFWCFYQQEPIPFEDYRDMLFKMETLFDDLAFPVRANNFRSFKEERLDCNQKKRMTRVMNEKELLEKHGDLGTFVVRVQHRQNSTWQGKVTWTEKNETKSFRSVFELVKLIESATGDNTETSFDTKD